MSEFEPRRPATSGDAPFDVCVIGGGPAGAALALRLAQLGRRVAIAEKVAFPRPHVGEALTAGAVPLLEALGVGGAVEAAGFLRSAWATVEWAGERRRYRPHGGAGLIVDRARFDALLLRAAAAMPDVDLRQPARVVRAQRERDLWTIALDTGETLRARYLAEASGRAHVLRRTRRRLGAPTLALYAYFRDVAVGEAAETLVEAGASAWYWGAPIPGGEFNATVFVDPRQAVDYEALIRKSRLLGPRLEGARRSTGIRVCDATAFVEQATATPTSIKVGDAALALDPLSSQGLETALGTALHAAIVLNTLIDRPDDAELAVGFYRDRIARSADFHAAAAAALYRDQAAIAGGSFWIRRAEGERPGTSDPLDGRRSDRFVPGARVAVSPRLRFAVVAVAGETHVTRHDGVTLAGRNYVFVGRGVGVASLLRSIDGPLPSQEVVARWSARMPPRQALAVLQWVLAEGLMCVERPTGQGDGAPQP